MVHFPVWFALFFFHSVFLQNNKNFFLKRQKCLRTPFLPPAFSQNGPGKWQIPNKSHLASLTPVYLISGNALRSGHLPMQGLRRAHLHSWTPLSMMTTPTMTPATLSPAQVHPASLSHPVKSPGPGLGPSLLHRRGSESRGTAYTTQLSSRGRTSPRGPFLLPGATPCWGSGPRRWGLGLALHSGDEDHYT